MSCSLSETLNKTHKPKLKDTQKMKCEIMICEKSAVCNILSMCVFFWYI